MYKCVIFPIFVFVLCVLESLCTATDLHANFADVDFSNPENVRQVIQALSVALKESKTAQGELEEEVKKVRRESEEQKGTLQQEIRNLDDELKKMKDDPQYNMTNIRQIASQFQTFSPPLGADYRHRFRSSRNTNPLDAFGAANYTLLEQLVKLMVPVSCYQWRLHGFDISGYYLIDPDGRGVGEPPFTVYCDMVSGYTFVHHNSEGSKQADTCTGSKCHSKKIEYFATQQQILALMIRSDSCQQYIRIDCMETPLKEDGEALSTWIDRQGKEQQYWAGAKEEHMCTCGMSQSCIDPRKSCNCDAAVRGVTLTDQGYLSSLSSLPVQGLQFGSQLTSQLQLNYTLGPLRCFGSRQVSDPHSCRDLLVSGQFQSGYYLLNINSTVDLVFCNMTEVYLSHHTGTEPPLKQIQFTKMKEMEDEMMKMKEEMEDYKKQVAFSAHTTGNVVKANEYIKFNNVTLNIGNGYDPSTGQFTVPKTGLYFISVHMITFHPSDTHTEASMYKNGGDVMTGFITYTQDGHDRINIGISIIESLIVGDTVSVKLTRGKIHAYNKGTRFNGFLLK